MVDVQTDSHPGQHSARPAIVIAALGVVFGDIGTSPIYTLQTVFNPADPHPVPISRDHIFGIVSLIFWSVMIIVTLTYVTLVMRADNNGEGGIMALITLLRRSSSPRGRRTAAILAALGIFGAALFFGDSMITPAISVLSAVEGLKIVEPSLESWIVPITAVIIVGLFSVQRQGFGDCGALLRTGDGRLVRDHRGVWNRRCRHPPADPAGTLADVRTVIHHREFPHRLLRSGRSGPGRHGRRSPLRRHGAFRPQGHHPGLAGWCCRRCTLSYLGQGALLIGDERLVNAPFFLLVPAWGRIPIVLLATAATVIASQAVVTGAFSVASQAAQLGYLPRLRIAHTSASTMGQIYVPWINGLLMISVLTLVFAFRSSAALGYAYGMAVTGTITITTLLFFYLARTHWHTPLWLVLLGAGALLTVDLLFFAANMTKLVHGAWLPLLIGIVAFTVMTTWQKGRHIVTAEREAIEGPLPEFIAGLTADPTLARIPGTGVFLNRGKETAPLAMRTSVEHVHALHEHVIILSLETEPVPRVPDAERISVDDLGHQDDGIFHVAASFGYMEKPDVPAALRLVDPADTEGPIALDQASYFLSKLDLVAGDAPTMAPWRTRLFIATSYITGDAAAYFGLPLERTVIIGSRLEI